MCLQTETDAVSCTWKIEGHGDLDSITHEFWNRVQIFLGHRSMFTWTEKVSWWLGQVSCINQVVKKLKNLKIWRNQVVIWEKEKIKLKKLYKSSGKKNIKNLQKLKKSSGNLREEKNNKSESAKSVKPYQCNKNFKFVFQVFVFTFGSPSMKKFGEYFSLRLLTD